MIQTFLEFIRNKELFTKKDRVLLALSGGIDSMVMLDLFLKTGFKTGIIHCNFSLRGKESDGDERFLHRVADKHGLEFFCRRFSTEEYARGEKVSIQMAARDLRYAYFEEVRKSAGYQVTATAHQLNDAVETTIFNMTKGTGITGLTGIPVKSGYVVRPLLFAGREEIAAYARLNKIRWREDSSNQSIKYSRNLIRHKVIPVLQEINPNVLNSMKRTMERAGSAEQFLLRWIGRHRKELVRREKKIVYIDSRKLRNEPDAIVLHYLLREYGFNYEQSGMIFLSIGGQPGKRYYSVSHELAVDRNRLVISPRKSGKPEQWEVNERQHFVETGDMRFEFRVIKKPSKLKTPSTTAYLDAEKIAYPLLVRSPETGDRFQPFGMKGKQKLSDFMINNKIPRNLKNNLKLVVSGGEIAWVAGYRISEKFRVEESTRTVLRIQLSDVHEESV